MTDVVELTKALIAAPSFVDDANNESAVAQLLVNILGANPRLTVQTQAVSEGRFNIIATTAGEPSLLLAGHMDTVPLCSGWSRALTGEVDGNRLYGLGAYDMKGGLGAIVSAVLNAEQLPAGLTLLFYCDEEYDFAGMKAYLASYDGPRPQLAVVAEPSDEMIWNSHRGIAEMAVKVRGRSAHASRPYEGVNAITGALAACEAFSERIVSPDDELGVTTVNVAGITGGLQDASGTVFVQSNAVPDYAEFTLDIRTSKEEYIGSYLADLLETETRAAGCEVIDIEVRHDLGALKTPPAELGALQDAMTAAGLPIEYADGKKKGYGDAQMLRQAWAIPVCNFGPSGSGMHGADEFVDIDSLRRTEQVYAALLNSFA